MNDNPSLARPGKAQRVALLAAAVFASTLALGAQFLLADRYEGAAELAARQPAPVAQAPSAPPAKDRL